MKTKRFIWRNFHAHHLVETPAQYFTAASTLLGQSNSLYPVVRLGLVLPLPLKPGSLRSMSNLLPEALFIAPAPTQQVS